MNEKIETRKSDEYLKNESENVYELENIYVGIQGQYNSP
jgi:hypothetical protein